MIDLDATNVWQVSFFCWQGPCQQRLLILNCSQCAEKGLEKMDT